MNDLSKTEVDDLRELFRQDGHSWETFQAADQARQAYLAVRMLRLTADTHPGQVQSACRNVSNEGSPICIIGTILTVLSGKPEVDGVSRETLGSLLHAGGMIAGFGHRIKLFPTTMAIFGAAQMVADEGKEWGVAALAGEGAYTGLSVGFDPHGPFAS